MGEEERDGGDPSKKECATQEIGEGELDSGAPGAKERNGGALGKKKCIVREMWEQGRTPTTTRGISATAGMKRGGSASIQVMLVNKDL